MKLLAIWLALVVLATSAASAAGAEPHPDAAPQAPAVSPDPAPEAAPQSTEPPASPPAATTTAPAHTQTTAPAPNTPPQPRERAAKRVAKTHHTLAKARPAEHAAAGDSAGSMVRIHALLPGTQPADDSTPGVFVLAAGALLALVLASGSMASAASRAMKGQLR